MGTEEEVVSGKRCKRCYAYMWLGSDPYSLCSDCKTLDDSEQSVHHGRMIRCPYCRHIADVYNFEDGKLYDEDVHEVWCSECDNNFEVETHVSYDFESPAMGEGTL